ncbi:hypothetical protein AJ78_04755 [Emergomyces pasteurianus Ep9510]|uniref:Tf2-1-like SH3-like domain-containing protein n=1 Tax=Emergomyces pasteurianus Ep9510 TaxID=1447872 RepID=A0A1J9QG98_9EURO|nr:hypothetical protein AJ78_04755 [Emergomyces pasteurianus Ep9510]
MIFASQSQDQLTSADHFLNSHTQLRQQVEDTLAMTRARMATYFDDNHQLMKLSGKAYLHVVRKGTSEYTLSEHTTLHPIKIGPFRIIEKVSPLSYRLDLPRRFRSIHPVISIIHLEPYIPDEFDRPLPAGPQEIL